MPCALETKARRAIAEHDMLKGVSHVVVGLSGGADSVALTHFLAGLRGEFGFSLSALHLNHMLRGGEAERDEAHAVRFCGSLNIPISVFRLPISDIAKERGVSFETAGRDERYRLFAEEAATHGGLVATAHTASDLAETLLLNLMRGTGLAGLRSIPPVRGFYIRPLIDCLRADVELYCREKGLEYVTDSTNLSTDYARNRVRLELIPYMEKNFNPSVVEALRRTAASAREDEAALASLTPREGGTAALSLLPYALRSRAIRSMSPAALSYEQVREIDSLVMSGKNGVVASLPRGLEARCQYGRLTIAPAPLSILPQRLAMGDNAVAGFGVIRLAKEAQKSSENIYNSRIKCDIIQDAFLVRSRLEGDCYRPVNRPKKTLARMAKDAKLPASLRGRLPVITAGGRIVAAFPFGPSEEAAAGEGEALVVTYIPEFELFDITTD